MRFDDVIQHVHSREVLDSRGNPTVEAEVQLQGGAVGRAIVPSGASTGKHEALELRDADASRYGGKGVRQAVANVKDILGPKIVGLRASDQAGIDALFCQLDGTADKSRLGANAILGVSLACAHAAAAARGISLWRYLDTDNRASVPMPMVNLISGGLHAGGNLEIQDFLLLPLGAGTFGEALEMTVKVYRSLGTLLLDHGYEGVLVGDEGGFGPRLESNEQALQMIVDAIEHAKLRPGVDAAIAIDIAATHFHDLGKYKLDFGGKSELSSLDMVQMLRTWVGRYPVFSIEDGLAEDDWTGWQHLTVELGDRLQLIGDDLFVTNPRRLQRGIAEKAANSVLVKPNQIGTLTETLALISLARSAGYRTVISARSGETEDATIADLAVGTGAGQIKIGSVARSERLAKYNRLLRIEEELGSGRFASFPKP
jgi:enolase